MFKRQIDKPFGEVLVERGVIDRKQLNFALEVQRDKGGLIGSILVDLDFLGEEDIAQTLSLIYGFPFLPLDSYDVPSELVEKIPRRVVEYYEMIPIDKIGTSVTVAMVDPLNKYAIEDVKFLTGCEVQIFISTHKEVSIAIENAYPPQEMIEK